MLQILKGKKYFGMGLLAAVWLWLVVFIFIRGGITLMNILWVVISGIIVFVPLYKKYFRNQNEK